MRTVCPHCRSTRVRSSLDGTRLRCLACLFSWRTP